MRKLLVYLSCGLLFVLPLLAEVAGNRTNQRWRPVERLSSVLRGILDEFDYPQDLLDRTDCIVVFPLVSRASHIEVAAHTGGAQCRAGRAMISRASGAHQR